MGGGKSNFFWLVKFIYEMIGMHLHICMPSTGVTGVPYLICLAVQNEMENRRYSSQGYECG